MGTTLTQTQIVAAREALGMTQEDAAKAAGIPLRSYQAYERGEREPKDSRAEAIRKALHMRNEGDREESPEGGNAPIFMGLADSPTEGFRSTLGPEVDNEGLGGDIPATIEPPPDPASIHDDEYVSMPYAPHGVGAGDGADNSSADHSLAVRLPKSFYWKSTGHLPRDAYWTVVRGQSMLPYLEDGQPICIERTGRYEGEGRYALRYDDDTAEVVKRCQRAGPRRLRITSDNAMYDPTLLEWVEDDVWRDLDTGLTTRLAFVGPVIWPPDREAATKRQTAAEYGHLFATVLRELGVTFKVGA